MKVRSVISKQFALQCQICVCKAVFAPNPWEFDWEKVSEKVGGGAAAD